MQKYMRNGQVGLLLLVIMGVVVALVLSVASRSLSDTVLSRQERESSAAFSVAETGIEKAMNEIKTQGGDAVGGPLTGLTDFVSGEYGIAPSTTYGLFVKEGETANLDLSTYVPTLTISWTRKADAIENITTCTEGSQSAPAALEISAFAGNVVTRSYYNPSSCSPGANGFSSSSDGGSEYRSMIASYAVPPLTTVLRIKPIYAGATITVSSATGVALADQLYLIQSSATGGDAKKAIEVKRGLDAPPSIFDFAVFTAGTIVK